MLQYHFGMLSSASHKLTVEKHSCLWGFGHLAGGVILGMTVIPTQADSHSNTINFPGWQGPSQTFSWQARRSGYD